MPPTIQVGTILMKDWPGATQPLGLESEPCSGSWSVLKVLDGFALDRKIHAAGWNFFFIAAEVKVMFLGSVGAAKIENALQGLLRNERHFNSLEITGIVGIFWACPTSPFPRIRATCNRAATDRA